MKLLVVDDHPLIREALSIVLSELTKDSEILSARTLAEAQETLGANADVRLVVLDLSLPDTQALMDGLSSLRDEFPNQTFVVISAHYDRRYIVECLDRGASGFIPKTASHEVILGALRLVLSGGVYVPPQVLGEASGARPSSVYSTGLSLIRGTKRLAGSGGSGKSGVSPRDFGLTGRQAQVLRLMVQGKTNKAICRELGLAEGTVKVHVTAILKILNVRNRTQALLEVSRLGLIFDSEEMPVS